MVAYWFFFAILNLSVIVGGSAAKYLCEHLPTMDTDWSKWRIFFCDERHVPQSDPDSTCGFYNKNLFRNVSISKDHIYEDNTSLSGSFSFSFMKVSDICYMCTIHVLCRSKKDSLLFR